MVHLDASRAQEKGPVDKGLKTGALGLISSVVVGVASTAPAYSLAATTAVLIGVVGVLAPASLLYCGLIMFGIVFAFRHLNSVDANAGATYSWLSSIFSPAIGFFACWSVIVGSALLSYPARSLQQRERSIWSHLIWSTIKPPSRSWRRGGS